MQSAEATIPIAVIGTAGRGPDARSMDARKFAGMVTIVGDTAAKLSGGRPWRAVSGGAAWSDHIGVVLFLMGAATELELHLPAQLYFDGYVDSGERGKDAWKTNPGGRLNDLHFEFSAATNRDSFADFVDASKKPGFHMEVTPGFFPRNTRVAMASTHCIALTFGSGAVVADGGTHDTVKKFLGKKAPGRSVHIDLRTMAAYSPARLA